MNENKSLVSVIVPVYNAEKYLSEAIESVLNQTYKDFELLLINDRSTDNSREICEKYAAEDNRIVLLENDTEHHGPGPTRNIGLDHATGEYIYFMDADDGIDQSLLQCAVNRMLETNADIVQFGVVYEQGGGKEPAVYCHKGKDVFTREEMKKDFLAFWNGNRMSLWLQFFRSEKVKSIRFENILNGEDVCYAMDALCNAEVIAYLPEALYHYRFLESSVSHRWINNTIECREIIWNHKRDFLNSFHGGIDKSIYAEAAYDNYIWTIFLLSSNACPLDYKEKKQQLSKMKEKTEFDQYRKDCPLKHQHGINKVKYILVKYRLEGIMLWFGPFFLRIVRGG